MEEAEDTSVQNRDAMFELIVSGDKKGLVQLLKSCEDAKALVQMRDRRGRLPQVLACMTGKAECLEVLADNGANLEARYSKHEMTLQHLASSWGHADCLRYLIEVKGLDDSVKSGIGTTLMDEAEAAQRTETIDFLQIRRTKSEMVEFITKLKSRLEDPKLCQQVGIAAEEKSKAIQMCNKRLDWLNSTKAKKAILSDVQEQRDLMMQVVDGVVGKLEEAGRF